MKTQYPVFPKTQVSFLKIASCSITDWPLLEKIRKRVALPKSIIASTGGCPISELDRAVSFLRKIPTSLELMHFALQLSFSEAAIQLGLD